MKISRDSLMKACGTLLVVYPFSAIILTQFILTPEDSYGLLAALLAVNAGAAFFVGHALGLPEYSNYTPGVLRNSILSIAVASGLLSAMFWVSDEVGHLGIQLALVTPGLIIILIAGWFIHKVEKERKKREEE